MEYVVIPDTAIIAVNRGKQENQSSNIVYRDKNGELRFQRQNRFLKGSGGRLPPLHSRESVFCHLCRS